MDSFRCGHPKSPENMIYRGRKLRCLVCVRASEARSNSRLRVKEKEAREGVPCLLSDAWR